MIPTKLKIGGIVYKIEQVTSIDNGREMARIEFNKSRILLDKRAPREQQEVALWHEIFHAINNEIPHFQVESLAQAIYQVLKDNHMLKGDKCSRK